MENCSTIILLIISFIGYCFGQQARKFELFNTNAAIDGPQPWFDDQVPSKDHCFHKCLKNFTNCEYIQYRKITDTSLWCKLFNIVTNLSDYLVSASGEMLAKAVHPPNCQEWRDFGFDQSGVYYIYHDGKEIPVYCMMKEQHGWIAVQQRQVGSVDFYRNWTEYRNGFGDPATDYYLGNELIHQLTFGRQMQIAIMGQDFNDELRILYFDGFYIENEQTGYKLHAGTFSTDSPSPESLAGNWLEKDGVSFSTKDNDNDPIADTHCAEYWNTAGWLTNCFTLCFNGPYSDTESVNDGLGVMWHAWKGWGSSLKHAGMYIREMP